MLRSIISFCFWRSVWKVLFGKRILNFGSKWPNLHQISQTPHAYSSAEVSFFFFVFFVFFSSGSNISDGGSPLQIKGLKCAHEWQKRELMTITFTHFFSVVKAGDCSDCSLNMHGCRPKRRENSIYRSKKMTESSAYDTLRLPARLLLDLHRIAPSSNLQHHVINTVKWSQFCFSLSTKATWVGFRNDDVLG